MKLKHFILLFILACSTSFAFCQAENQKSENSPLSGFLIPAIIAAVGYVLKSIYEIFIDNRKRKRVLLEKKLEMFYWPILIRLERNQIIFRTIIESKNINDPQSLESKMRRYLEIHSILQTDEEILEILTKYRYLATVSSEFEDVIMNFIKYVTIYRALLDSQETNQIKTDLTNFNVFYPSKFDNKIRETTFKLQKELNKSPI